jgi:hypothetical protein
MRFQVRAQSLNITNIKQVYRSPEHRILDSFVVRERQVVGASWFFDTPL